MDPSTVYLEHTTMNYFYKYNVKTIITYGYRFLWWIYNRRRFNKLDRRSYIQHPIKLTPSCIDCGKNVFVFKSARIEGVYRYNETIFTPSIVFEDCVTVQQNLHLTCAKKVVIGSNTAIAANVTITDIHHSYKDVKVPIEKQNIEVKEVRIGKDCKIYNNCVILPGCTIGNHVTIGANSVVAGCIPSFSVAGGLPAKIIKRFNFETNRWEKTNPDGSFL